MSSYFEDRERALLGERYGALYAGTAAPARGLTVNTLRCTPAQFAALWGPGLRPSPFCKAGFLAPEKAAFRPGVHPYHHAGAFYSQEPSASAPAPLLDVRPGMRVLDLCAAPGGKSSQLAAALAGQGLLVANEPVPARAEILRQNLERMGVANAVVLNEQPARIAAALPGYFDRVLVDAPCSGEGMFRKEPEALRQHSEQLVAQCAALGREILDCAAQALAPGGELVYSTCTFAPQEDEGQVGAFLARHPEFELCDLSQVGFGRPGEANRSCGRPLNAGYCRRIWPADGGEGHFMAKLRKYGQPGGALGTLPRPAKSAARERCKGKTDARGGAKAAREAAALWRGFAAEYFGGAPALQELAVTLFNDMLLLDTAPLPPTGLHLLRAGLLAGSVAKGRFVPAHALFMAAGGQCANQERLTLADPRTAAWLRGEEIEARSAANGWCAVLVDGFPLGGGKVSGGRVKNHYPKALRNLK